MAVNDLPHRRGVADHLPAAVRLPARRLVLQGPAQHRGIGLARVAALPAAVAGDVHLLRLPVAGRRLPREHHRAREPGPRRRLRAAGLHNRPALHQVLVLGRARPGGPVVLGPARGRVLRAVVLGLQLALLPDLRVPSAQHLVLGGRGRAVGRGAGRRERHAAARQGGGAPGLDRVPERRPAAATGIAQPLTLPRCSSPAGLLSVGEGAQH
mmetsp:Transcript_43029/g.136756  ORF Transcript_43029/g.136756 Transcript_43029/m.136756 type:complete len:211 (+) Transcript_43029:851-1483(+)